MLVNCVTGNHSHGCNGGDLPDAWAYLAAEGIVSEACLPYSSGNGTGAKCLPGECTGSGTWQKPVDVLRNTS